MNNSPESLLLQHGDYSFREFASRPEYRVVTEEYMKDCVEKFLSSPDYDPVRPPKIVVIGSGNGLGLQGIFSALGELQATIICMDLNESAIQELLQTANPSDNIKLTGVIGDGTHLPFKDDNFDLEFLPNWLHMLNGKTKEESFELKKTVIKEVKRTLKSNGRLHLLGSFIEDMWIPTTADGIRWGKLRKYSIDELGTIDEESEGFIKHTLEEYVSMFTENDLKYDEESKVEVVVPLTADSARTIPIFTSWTEGMFLDMVERDEISLQVKIETQQRQITKMELDHLRRGYHKGEMTPFTMARRWVGLTAVKP